MRTLKLRNSSLDLIWPVAGIDRSVSYQRQPPYTTPDALNVRTDDIAEYRERGGSRPGLGLEIRTTTTPGGAVVSLGGPVRLLTKVSVLRANWPQTYQPAFGSQFNLLPTPAGWGTSPTVRIDTYGAGTVLTGANYAVAYPTTFYTGVDTSAAYEITYWLKPALGEAYNGTVTIAVALASFNDLQDDDSNAAKLTFTPGVDISTASYSGEIREWATAIDIGSTISGSFTDTPNQPGPLTVRFDPVTKLMSLYWRRQLVVQRTVGFVYGAFHNMRVVSSDSTIEVFKVGSDFARDAATAEINRSLRRDLLVAVSEGEIWREDTSVSLTKVSGGPYVFSDGELTAADREQLLYIADYGASVGGSAADIAGAGYNTLQDTAVNFTTLGITTDYALELVDSDYSQNEQQGVELFNCDGGGFRLRFRGQYTAPIDWNANATGLNSVKSALEAISTIDTVDVAGLAGGPWVIEFTGSLAGQNIELLGYDISGLTDSGGAIPAISILDLRDGAGGEFVLGSYSITSVAGDTITFDPPIDVYSGFASTISDVVYRVVRIPKVYDPSDDSVVTHSATSGSVPAGCRLVCLYRDRIVYAASDLLPHVWYMSRQGDPYDWDYSQEDSGAAIFAQASVGGQLADPITALVAHGDECLIIGCYNSLWILRGDPGYGGTIDELSRKIGIVGPHAWCKTPDNMCVFLSPDGLYVMPAGCHGFPTSLSRERLPDNLLCVNQQRTAVSLEYDSLHRGIHIFVTNYDSSTADHWWFDWEAKAFWRVGLQTDHEPFSLHERIAWDDCPTVLIGGRDGYIRSFSRDNEVDDQNNAIDSYCILGPFHLDRGGYYEGVLASLTATTGKDSGDITWEVLAGESAEFAVKATARETGTWNRGGLNYRNRPRVRGTAACVKVSNAGVRRWFLERITAVIRSAGERRVR